MDNYQSNKHNTTTTSLLQQRSSAPPSAEDLTLRTSSAFEYTLPTSEADDDTTTTADSNSSTPYYTPLEFFQSSFEFPSPKWLDQTKESISPDVNSSISMLEEEIQISTDQQQQHQNLEEEQNDMKMSRTPKPYSITAAGVPKQLQSSSSTSPGISNRKLRRFTFNERRSCSCSPQHMLSKNSNSVVECCPANESSTVDGGFVMDVDKENTKPKYQKPERNDVGGALESGNNSPMLLYDESSGSPKIFTASDASSMLAAAAAVAVANNQRLTPYSPKLLASINNLNLSGGGGGGGSPLGVINSAGYKHGNYFKFPEIDHIVQEHAVAEQIAQMEEYSGGLQVDNQLRTRQKRLGNTSPASPLALHLKSRFKSSSFDMEHVKTSLSAADAKTVTELVASAGQDSELSKSSVTAGTRRTRINKNVLRVEIFDVQEQHDITAATSLQQHQPPLSPALSPKPKTPTIKSTKEKALSLDSAATGEMRLSVASCGSVESHAASNEALNAQSDMPPSLMLAASSSACSLKQNSSNISSGGVDLRNSSAGSIRSTSLSQLATPSKAVLGGKALSSQRNADTVLARSNRRRVPGTPSNEWLQYHRKQNPFKLQQNLNTDAAKKAALLDVVGTEAGTDINLSEVVLLKEDDEVHGEKLGSSYSHIQSTPNSSTATSTFLLTPTHRGIHKHNPILHASNTNLKTLPEFLTLVEFSTPAADSSTDKELHEYPYKQKSIDLPSSTLPQPPVLLSHSSGIGSGTVIGARSKTINCSSSNNLLQRRGSNHSLTLSLHGSCSNLLGSRSGFSVSNYSLGGGSSVANSTNNLNSKSSYNLNVSNANTPHSVNVIHQGIAPAGPATTQDAKQSLFRRGSNYSVGSHPTANLTATSCGNLNSFASQNSLNVVDRSNLGGVTRTTSFVTPSKTTSSVAAKRGLLERRGSNQSFSVNTSSSFGGIGCSEQTTFAASHLFLDNATETTESQVTTRATPCCAVAAHQRKFFSSESLDRANTQFSDLNQAHKRNAKQVCFGSVSDLKPNNTHEATNIQDATPFGGGTDSTRRDHFNFQESTICSCTGVRNIATRPLSPQTTSEEFKVYLANIQMLQNASNALNQLDLIKLNYIFDNSYATSNSNNMVDQPLPLLNIPPPSLLSSQNNKETESPPGLLSTSEDSELAAGYLAAVCDVLPTIQPDDNEQKRMFRDLHKEFWDLPLNHQEKPMVFGSQTKNRYKTILPNENSRVLLDREYKQFAEHIAGTGGDIVTETSISKQFLIADEVPYINANYIKGPDYTSKCYIATQGPLPNTIFEFWLMIYQNTHKHFQMSTDKAHSPLIKAGTALQQYYQKIVMLTSILENHRQKCSVYFPSELNEIFITTHKQEVMPPSEALMNFFDAYLKQASPPPSNYPTMHGASIETFKISLDSELGKQLCLNNASPSNFFVLKNIGIVKKNGFAIRKFAMLYCVQLSLANTGTTSESNEPHQLLVHKLYCFHYWYPDWPDHRSPRDINTLLDMCLHILNLGKCETEFEVFSAASPASTPEHTEDASALVDLFQQDIFNVVQPLPVIHCSAGIGRTGCLTAILNGVRQLRQSLAYSLTSMATTASKGAVSATAQLLSPVDFCLPAEFLREVNCGRQQSNNGSNDIAAMSNDTDSSFTRATYDYIKYIKRMQKAEQDEQLEDEEQMAELSQVVDSLSQMPTLSELPKLPDVFVDILGIVCNLRLQRGGMVQNSEQYELIYRAVCLYLKRTFALKRF